MDVLLFYNEHSPQFKNEKLTSKDLQQLEAFMNTLIAPLSYTLGRQ